MVDGALPDRSTEKSGTSGDISPWNDQFEPHDRWSLSSAPVTRSHVRPRNLTEPLTVGDFELQYSKPWYPVGASLFDGLLATIADISAKYSLDATNELTDGNPGDIVANDGSSGRSVAPPTEPTEP